ncbi:MAG: hypothetical protein J0I63_10865, partial [Thiobacillus sp.]|nr:hypothetical protein [Thiobacillus sp.]
QGRSDPLMARMGFISLRSKLATDGISIHRRSKFQVARRPRKKKDKAFDIASDQVQPMMVRAGGAHPTP